ncbi:MAG: hypothetical protein KDG50_06920 [Chromatiales bacterium]|nr:hypothetical protein [Chromatiales bacterium]
MLIDILRLIGAGFAFVCAFLALLAKVIEGDLISGLLCWGGLFVVGVFTLPDPMQAERIRRAVRD